MVASGNRVYLGSNCGYPRTLVRALCQRSASLRNVEIVHLLVSGETPYVQPEHRAAFHHVGFFISGNTRRAYAEGRCDYRPMFLSEVPKALEFGSLKVDVVMLAVSTPDESGEMSLGVSVDLSPSAIRSARHVIVEINEKMPRTCGPVTLNLRDVDAIVEADFEMLEHKAKAASEVDHRIAANVRTLIEDGSCLQIGIGHVPDAILSAIGDRNDLGVHSELIGDEIGRLFRSGNITNTRKAIMNGVSIASFTLGTRELYETIDRNPHFQFHGSEFVNDPYVIAQNPNVVAVNGALQIDLTGQVVSDSLGFDAYSGVGGQVDFIRGASRSVGGKPIIALPSTARNGEFSRIVPSINAGSGVTTSRADVHWVATEHGLVNLFGLTLRERCAALIGIADPSFRDELRSEARSVGLES